VQDTITTYSQRLESLILFIGSKRNDLRVNQVWHHFFDRKLRKITNFKISVGSEKLGLADLDEKLVRDLRDYIIPTIEITLSEDHPAALDEIISLFVDINSYGEVVKRFDIVKAMSKDPLLQSAFDLLALKQERRKDILYRPKRNDFTRVLQKLQVVKVISRENAQVDRVSSRNSDPLNSRNSEPSGKSRKG
jgi:hypothetical protein